MNQKCCSLLERFFFIFFPAFQDIGPPTQLLWEWVGDPDYPSPHSVPIVGHNFPADMNLLRLAGAKTALEGMCYDPVTITIVLPNLESELAACSVIIWVGVFQSPFHLLLKTPIQTLSGFS